MAEPNENSVITKTRRIKTCKASSGAIDTLPPVAYMAFGDGGTDEGGEPIPPTEDQTALKHEISRYPVGDVTYPVETTARYSVTVPKTDMVGQSIDEVALIDSEGDAVAIKTMYAKKKDAGAAFTFTLDDEF